MEAAPLAKHGASTQGGAAQVSCTVLLFYNGAAAALVSSHAHLRLALALLSARCASTAEHQHNDVLQLVKVESKRRRREVKEAVVVRAAVTGHGTSTTVLSGKHKSTCRFQFICAYKVLDKKPVSSTTSGAEKE